MADRYWLIPSSDRISARCSPRVNRVGRGHWVSSSVEVRDFNLHCALVCREEAHAPLVVDADAMGADPVTTQRCEPVGGRQSEVGQRRCGNDPLQSHSRPALNVRRQATNRFPVEEPFRIMVPESIDCALY